MVSFNFIRETRHVLPLKGCSFGGHGFLSYEGYEAAYGQSKSMLRPEWQMKERAFQIDFETLGSA